MKTPLSMTRYAINVLMLMLGGSLLATEAQANAGFADQNPLPGVTTLDRTYYAHSPLGLHGPTACFDSQGQRITPVLGDACDTGIALEKFVEKLPLFALPGKLAIPPANGKKYFTGASVNTLGIETGKYIPVAIPTKWVNAQGVMSNDDYYEIAVVEYKHRFHKNLTNDTLTRGYVQIDPAATDAAAGLNNGATPIPGSLAVHLVNPITGQNIQIPRLDSNAALGTTPVGDVLGDDGLPYKMVDAIAVDNPHYLGPVITASRNIPTRVKFINLLPVGRASGSARNGDLFLPVDETLPGAGFGPDGKVKYTQNRALINLHGGDNPWISDGTPHQWITPAGEATATNGVYAEAIRNTISPADAKHYLRGWSAANVPDMPNPGPGAMTYYFPNGQSARMEWYHDNSFGIARLNAYAGVASLYMLEDPSDSLEATYKVTGVIPSEEIPLVFQDKTFVPKDIEMEDAKWDTVLWGGESNLWYPHVYETNQNGANPYGQSGSLLNANGFGRWDWGPWFWPVFPSYYDRLPDGTHNISTNSVALTAAHNGLTEVTGTPKAIMDTVVVNGEAYPTVTVDPKAYRFRMLNASNDRYLNLGLYLAADKQTLNIENPASFDHQPIVCDGVSARDGGVKPTVADCTEMKMVNFDTSYPVSYYPTLPAQPFGAAGNFFFPGTPNTLGTPDGWGSFVGMLGHEGKTGSVQVPDPATAGPDIQLIGNDSGFQAQSVTVPSTIANYEDNTRSITITNVLQRGVYMGPGNRVDAVIDFSQYAGQTLILYNDAPAPSPASDARYDFFTGMGDFTAAGGSDETQPGFGPNTRTIMQIHVNGPDEGVSPATPLNVAALGNAIPALFAKNQPMPIIPEPDYALAYPNDRVISSLTAYNYASIMTGVMCGAPTASACSSGRSGYQGLTFRTTQPITYTQISGTCYDAATCDQSKRKTTLPTGGGTVTNAYVTLKTLTEEFEPTYGRMYSTLGVERPYSTSMIQTSIPLAYIDPTTDTVADGETVFWRLTHNGVDDHPIHFEYVNVQVIDRVGWDGTLKTPPPEEAGWKDTVIAHPLEDIFVAVRAKAPAIPFGLPTSSRPRDPSQALGVGGSGNNNNLAGMIVSGFTQVDPLTGDNANVTNQMDTYGWEYTWHSAALGDQQNDLMRPLVFDYWTGKNGKNAGVYTNLPSAPIGLNFNGNTLIWTDPTPVSATATFAPAPKNEIGFKVSRTDTSVSPAVVVNYDVAANQTYWTIKNDMLNGHTYRFQVKAYNALGNGLASNAVNLTYTAGSLMPPLLNPAMDITATSVTLSWMNSSLGATTYVVKYKLSTATTWTSMAPINVPDPSVVPVMVQAVTGLTANAAYNFQVFAVNGGTPNGIGSNILNVTTDVLGASAFGVNVTGPSSATATWTLPAGGTPTLTVLNVNTGTAAGTKAALNAAGTAITGLAPSTSYSVTLQVSGVNGVVSTDTVYITTNAAAAVFGATPVTGITTTGANVAWTNPASALVTRVAISPTTGGAAITFNGTSTSAATARSLTPNTLYTVTVTEVGVNGTGTPATTTFTTTPGSVTNLAFATTGASTGSLSWTLPAGGGRVGIAVSPAGPVLTLNPDSTAATLTGLAAATNYTFTVTLTGARAGAPTTLIATTPAAPVAAPTGASIQLASATSAVMRFSTVTGAASYKVQMLVGATWTDVNSTTSIAGTTVTATATGLTLPAGATYSFRAVGVNAASLSGSPSATVTINLAAVPASVTALTATAGGTGTRTITVAFTKAANNAAGINIYRRQTNGALATFTVDGWTLFTTLPGNATNFVDTGLTAGTGYQYYVVLTNAAGNSASSVLVPSGNGVVRAR